MLGTKVGVMGKGNTFKHLDTAMLYDYGTVMI